MGYDATPEDANLLDHEEVQAFCEKHDGNMHGMADCEIEGKNGSLWLSATPTQTSQQNSVMFYGENETFISGTSNADEVLLDPSHSELTLNVTSEMATAIPNDSDVTVAIKEGGMMSTFGIEKK